MGLRLGVAAIFLCVGIIILVLALFGKGPLHKSGADKKNSMDQLAVGVAIGVLIALLLFCIGANLSQL